jgi:uncharacterized protein YxeA
MKNILRTLITILFIALVASCKVQMTTWQRSGNFVKHGNAYVFKPFEQWHSFDSSKAYPDTVYQFVYAKRKPN